MRELESQRQTNAQLNQEVFEERKRANQLESCLTQFLSPIRRVNSWGSLEDSTPQIGSLGSRLLMSTSDPALTENSIPKTGSYNAFSTILEEQWTSVPKVESWSSITSACLDLTETSAQPLKVGVYPAHIRQAKIRTYKEKQRKYRQKYDRSRVFNGRSRAAKKKLRVNGKFVKRG
jgi:hypothetical protein